MFDIVLIVMTAIAVVCFVALYFIPAGYGKMVDAKWGFAFNNKVGWCIMECPTVLTSITFIIMSCYFASFSLEAYIARILVLSFFILHYTYRSFIFPFLLRGKSQMPLTIVIMGFLFNTINSVLICYWTFYIAKPEFYSFSYFKSPLFIIGAFIFLLGFVANIDSDAYIRSLRQKGDTKHYFPRRHLYKYVSSANYLSEILEWLGFALLTNNPAAYLFVIWTSANLIPRSHAIYKKYKSLFPEEVKSSRIKRIIPFIY